MAHISFRKQLIPVCKGKHQDDQKQKEEIPHDSTPSENKKRERDLCPSPKKLHDATGTDIAGTPIGTVQGCHRDALA